MAIRIINEPVIGWFDMNNVIGKWEDKRRFSKLRLFSRERLYYTQNKHWVLEKDTYAGHKYIELWSIDAAIWLLKNKYQPHEIPEDLQNFMKKLER